MSPQFRPCHLGANALDHSGTCAFPSTAKCCDLSLFLNASGPQAVHENYLIAKGFSEKKG